MQACFFESAFGKALESGEVDKRVFGKLAISNSNIFGNTEMREDVELLMNDADAETLGIEGSVQRRRFAVEEKSVLFPAPFSPTSA